MTLIPRKPGNSACFYRIILACYDTVAKTLSFVLRVETGVFHTHNGRKKMNLSEYVQYDATGLAQLITSKQVSAQQVQQMARQAI